MSVAEKWENGRSPYPALVPRVVRVKSKPRAPVRRCPRSTETCPRLETKAAPPGAAKSRFSAIYVPADPDVSFQNIRSGAASIHYGKLVCRRFYFLVRGFVGYFPVTVADAMAPKRVSTAALTMASTRVCARMSFAEASQAASCAPITYVTLLLEFTAAFEASSAVG